MATFMCCAADMIVIFDDFICALEKLGGSQQNCDAIWFFIASMVGTILMHAWHAASFIWIFLFCGRRRVAATRELITSNFTRR